MIWKTCPPPPPSLNSEGLPSTIPLRFQRNFCTFSSSSPRLHKERESHPDSSQYLKYPGSLQRECLLDSLQYPQSSAGSPFNISSFPVGLPPPPFQWESPSPSLRHSSLNVRGTPSQIALISMAIFSELLFSLPKNFEGNPFRLLFKSEGKPRLRRKLPNYRFILPSLQRRIPLNITSMSHGNHPRWHSTPPPTSPPFQGQFPIDVKRIPFQFLATFKATPSRLQKESPSASPFDCSG